MGAHIKPQIIIQDGKPAFAVIPWDEYQRLLENQLDTEESEVWFPNDVVKANVRGASLVRAWREHFHLTQVELAEKAGIAQPALARMEKPDATPRRASLEKLAKAMGITVEQLIE